MDHSEHKCPNCGHTNRFEKSTLKDGPNFPACNYCGKSVPFWYHLNDDTTSDLEIENGDVEFDSGEGARTLDEMAANAAALNSMIIRHQDDPPSVDPENEPEDTVAPAPTSIKERPKRSNGWIIVVIMFAVLLLFLLLGLHEINIL